MIHEGTHGIQATDLLGRKLVMENGRALELLLVRIQATGERVGSHAELASYARDLAATWTHIAAAARAAWATGNPAEALANAVPFMQAFGHGVLAWIWLDVALAALASDPHAGHPATSGTLAATRFFYHYELPKTGAWLRVVESRDMTCANCPEEAF